MLSIPTEISFVKEFLESIPGLEDEDIARYAAFLKA
jgi:hypothetical protein